MYKNVTSQKLAIYAWDAANRAPKTGDSGNITGQYSLDAGACVALAGNPTELDATDAPGVYIWDINATISNGGMLLVYSKSSTADINIEPVIAYTISVPLTQAEIQSECEDALSEYDPPTRIEATADKDAVIAKIDTVNSNIGLGAIDLSMVAKEKTVEAVGQQIASLPIPASPEQMDLSLSSFRDKVDAGFQGVIESRPGQPSMEGLALAGEYQDALNMIMEGLAHIGSLSPQLVGAEGLALQETVEEVVGEIRKFPIPDYRKRL